MAVAIALAVAVAMAVAIALAIVVSISMAEAKAFVQSQSIGQVFQGRIASDGVIPGGGREDHRWQMDLIDFSKRIAKLNQSHKYVLVAADNYNREIWIQPMQNKTAHPYNLCILNVRASSP